MVLLLSPVSLPTDEELYIQQAVVFIEDAIQVTKTFPIWVSDGGNIWCTVLMLQIVISI